MTISKANDFIELAKYAASLADPIRNYRLGAVVLRGKERIIGWNSYRTHPSQARYGRNEFSIYLHAEIAAMVRAKWQADALIVVRIMADGTLGNSKPCSGWERALIILREVWQLN